MFTGLIEEVGKLKRVVKQGEAMVVTIAASRVLEGVALGDSIAVNGVCLTVISFTGSTFDADVMPETYRRSNLHQLKPGEQVNLERAMLAGGRFGGHMVQGHIDGTGVIAKRATDANAVIFSIKLNDAATLKYVIPKGSIAIDGISLTVVGTNDSGFSVSVIPHTLGETALLDKRIGDSVNIECDMIGKYVEHLLHFKPAREAGATSGSNAGKAGGAKLSNAFLSENGFM